jgi:tetratricopeptide (TPR) repeat protein
MLEVDAELQKVGERSFRSTIQATTAELCARLGEMERARRAVRLAQELVAPEDHLTLVGICAARARVALADDDPEAAERAARDAVTHADRTDVPFLLGHAHLELGVVLRARGRDQEASAAGHQALAIFRAKGDQPRIREALAFLAGLPRSAREHSQPPRGHERRDAGTTPSGGRPAQETR